MRVRMLGTGSSDGWPNPWCGCASCRAAAAAGVVRGQTSALVDDRLLVDLGPDGPRAALRQGADLTGVEAVLVTHGHPDHHAWPAWMWRGWAAGTRPLTLVAPPAVAAEARPRLDPSVRVVEVGAGDRLSVAGYDVVALPATHSRPSVGPAVLYDVTAPDSSTLLWATDTGVLSAAALELVRDRAYDAVLLDLTSAHLPDHHDLRTWPEQVAELRRVGAVVEGTAVHAVHVGHDNPPPDELDAVLAGWGASAPRDGDVLDVGSATAAAVRPRRGRVLVLGGARSGKSAYAEQRLAAEPQVTYVATAPDRAGDDDWSARVHAHVQRRPAAWTTLETGDVAAVLRSADAPLLVDDLGLWLVRAVDDADAWEGPLDAVEAACDELVAAWRACRAPVVLVAPEVGSGVVPSSASGRRFRDLLGSVTTRLAAASDEVVQVVAGLPREPAVSDRLVVEHPEPVTGADRALGRLGPALERLATLQGAWPPHPPRTPRTVVVAEDAPGDLADGLRRADELADAGVDLLVLGASGRAVPGLVACAALLDLEPVGAVGTASGPEWAVLTVGVRDGLRACRAHLSDPEDLLRALGSPGLAVLTGLLAQSAVRRTPVLLDGSALVAGAAMVAERLAPGASAWWLAGQVPPAPAAAAALRDLDLAPLLDLRLDRPEGAALASGVLTQAVELVRG